jgi:hypothetical protein
MQFWDNAKRKAFGLINQVPLPKRARLSERG